ncbi:MAG: hypothetical protein WCK53_05780 [Methanomicrobiales archaeon]
MMEITATLDRIEGELAALLLCGDEIVIFNLPAVFLAGSKKGILPILRLRRISLRLMKRRSG